MKETPTVMVETAGYVYIVDASVYPYAVALHPDAFYNDTVRGMANSLIVMDKKSGNVIKARSFDPNGNDH